MSRNRVWGPKIRASMALATVKALLGVYRRPDRSQLSTVNRLIFVCDGNICRSPYASERALALGFNALSCGINASGTAPADGTAASTASQRGIDIGAHRSTRFGDVTLKPTDLLLAMEPAQLGSIMDRAGESGAIVALLGLWGRPPTPWIADPYGADVPVFEEAFTMIDTAMAGLEKALRDSAPKG